MRRTGRRWQRRERAAETRATHGTAAAPYPTSAAAESAASAARMNTCAQREAGSGRVSAARGACVRRSRWRRQSTRPKAAAHVDGGTAKVELVRVGGGQQARPCSVARARDTVVGGAGWPAARETRGPLRRRTCAEVGHGCDGQVAGRVAGDDGQRRRPSPQVNMVRARARGAPVHRQRAALRFICRCRSRRARAAGARRVLEQGRKQHRRRDVRRCGAQSAAAPGRRRRHGATQLAAVGGGVDLATRYGRSTGRAPELARTSRCELRELQLFPTSARRVRRES